MRYQPGTTTDHQVGHHRITLTAAIGGGYVLRTYDSAGEVEGWGAQSRDLDAIREQANRVYRLLTEHGSIGAVERLDRELRAAWQVLDGRHDRVARAQSRRLGDMLDRLLTPTEALRLAQLVAGCRMRLCAA